MCVNVCAAKWQKKTIYEFENNHSTRTEHKNSAQFVRLIQFSSFFFAKTKTTLIRFEKWTMQIILITMYMHTLSSIYVINLLTMDLSDRQTVAHLSRAWNLEFEIQYSFSGKRTFHQFTVNSNFQSTLKAFAFYLMVNDDIKRLSVE